MMDEHILGVNVNAIRRFGRYYVRCRRRNSGVTVERWNTMSIGNQIEINKQNRILIDVPVQVQHVQKGNASVASGQSYVRTENDGLIEVTVTQSSHHPPVCFESVRMLLGSSDREFPAPPLGAFEAAGPSSRSTKRQRKSRSRRVDFDSIVLPTQSRKLSSRERNAIRQRRFRARQTTEQRLASQARQNIRRRNARLRQTPEQRAAAQALDTARRRIARQRKRAQQQCLDTLPVLALPQKECN